MILHVPAFSHKGVQHNLLGEGYPCYSPLDLLGDYVPIHNDIIGSVSPHFSSRFMVQTAWL